MFRRVNSLLLTVLILQQVIQSLSLTNGDLRLNGIGSSDLIGRLEVFYNGEWGTVCGGSVLDRDLPMIQFNIIAAHVACRQMGLGFAIDYYTFLHLPEHRYQFGMGKGPIFLEDIACKEEYSHLLQCTYGVIGQVIDELCDHSTDVVLQCSNVSSYYNGEIRLTHDPATPTSERFSSSGFLELFSGGMWKGVCQENVDTPTANVLCHQLGYTEAGSINSVASSWRVNSWYIEPSTLSCDSPTDVCIASCLSQLPVVARTTPCQPLSLSCVFNESNLDIDLPLGNRLTCSRSATPTPQGEVRVFLSEDSDPKLISFLTHRLDVFKGGDWGSVCSREFSFREVDVACKQLGYPSASDYSDVSDSSAPQGSGLVYNLHCTGLESHVTECDMTLSTLPDCISHSHDATISCSPIITPYGSLSIHGRPGAVGGASGTLVLFNGTGFHPVCDDGFKVQHATVACRQLGYSWGTPTNINNSYFGVVSNSNISPNLLRLVGSCSGSESQLLSCPPGPQSTERERLQGFSFVEAGSSEVCRQGLDEVAVRCVSDDIQLRLVGGASDNAGRLEVSYDGEWGRVCGVGFGMNEALVVCRNLGYKSVTSLQINERYGVGGGPIHFRNVSCSGIEVSLLHCQFILEGGVAPCLTSDVDVAIECGTEALPTDGKMRLVGGVSNSSNQSSGHLEISLNGEWLSVCGSYFSEAAAKVSCRQLGYSSVVSYCTDACFGEGSGGVLFVEDECNGDEDSLLSCHLDRRHPQSCNHSNDVGLICEGLIDTPDDITITNTGLPLFVYYIIAGCGGGVLLVIVMAIVICCIICCVRRRRRKQEGVWTNPRGENGHTHHHNGGAVVDVSRLANEKEGGFDDPKESLEMHRTSPNAYENSVAPQHDVILHALSHAHNGTESPTSEVKGQHPRGNQLGNGVVASNSIGIGHDVSPDLIPTCPPPDYNELFRSSHAQATPSSSHVTNGHGTWYEGSDSEDDKRRVN